MEKSLLSYGEAARELGCCEKTVWSMVHEYGTLPVITIGKRLKRIPRKAIDNYLDQSCKMVKV